MKASELIDFIIATNPEVIIKGVESTLSSPEFLKDLTAVNNMEYDFFVLITSFSLNQTQKNAGFFVDNITLQMIILSKFNTETNPNATANPVPTALAKWERIKSAENVFYGLRKEFSNQFFRANNIKFLSATASEIDFATITPRFSSGLFASFTFEIDDKVC